ncbi:MAG: GSCFA domain-containing protein [Lutibacter sp.]
MKFRTNITLTPEKKQISYDSQVLFLGSCFSENIAHKMDYFKFPTLCNPFGILYNPVAINSIVSRIITLDYFSENDVFQFLEKWQSFEVHSTMSHPLKNALISNLNNQLNHTHHFIKKSSHLFITLGTSWVYRHINTNKIVGNCHKIPQREFNKELLNISAITDSLQNLIQSVKSINKSIQIIFTVSPIRHLKDGFTENTLSKSHLITAIHQLTNQKSIFYFPSYEILLDDLRDYRFYAKDLVHPNDLAIEYIWEQFKNVWLTTSSFNIMKKVDSVQKAIAHKPFNPKSKKHQLFLDELAIKKQVLKEKYQIQF